MKILYINLYEKIIYNPKNGLIIDKGFKSSKFPKYRQKRMNQISLSVFLTPKEV